MPDLWTPNAELPHEAFIDRLHKAIASFAEATGVEKPFVEIELADQSRFVLDRIEPEAADEIARRARGTPRIANRILRRVRDVAEVRHAGAITAEIADEALELLEVDEAGLERFDRELLRAVVERFAGGPVGLSNLAVALGEEAETIEDVYEPYLLQLGFLQRTSRGRIVTELGREHVGAAREASSLF